MEAHAKLNASGVVEKVAKFVGVDVGWWIECCNRYRRKKFRQKLSHDNSAQQQQSYQESMDRVKDYAKTHDVREGVGTSDSLAHNIQDTWRQQEQVGLEKDNNCSKDGESSITTISCAAESK